MNNSQHRAIIALADGLRHFDRYSPTPSDDTPIFAVENNNDLYEFAHFTGQLTVGNLRDLLTIFQES